MDTRTWFRLLRRAEWERPDSLARVVDLYCRADTEPLGPRVRLFGLQDIQRLIDCPTLVKPAFDLIKADVQAATRAVMMKGLAD